MTRPARPDRSACWDMASALSSSPRAWVTPGLLSATWQQHLSSTHTQRSSHSPAEELQDNISNAGFTAGTRTSADAQLRSQLQRQAFVDLVDQRGLGKCVSKLAVTVSCPKLHTYNKTCVYNTQIANVMNLRRSARVCYLWRAANSS